MFWCSQGRRKIFPKRGGGAVPPKEGGGAVFRKSFNLYEKIKKIRQKILVNTEFIQTNTTPKSKKTFVLYLPDNEIHELGLMFLHHEIVANGYHSIFLGQSVPLESLCDVLNYYDDLVFLSYFTVKPLKAEIEQYIKDFDKTILKNSNAEFWILGQMLNCLDLDNLPKQITPFKSIKEVVSKLQ